MDKKRTIQYCSCCGLPGVSAVLKRFIPEIEVQLFDVLGIDLPKSIVAQFEERRNMGILLHYCPHCYTTLRVGIPLDSFPPKEAEDE